MFFSSSSSCADAGEGTRSMGKGEAAPLCLPTVIPVANPSRWPPHQGTGMLGCMGLSTREAHMCAGLPAPDRPFFLCLFLLSPLFPPRCHPVSPLPPPSCRGVHWEPRGSPSAAPLGMSDPRRFVLSRDAKVLNAAPDSSR